MGIDFSGALVLTAVVKEAGGPAGMVAFIFILFPKGLCAVMFIY